MIHELLARILNRCEICGKPIDAKYHLCYDCQRAKTFSFVNRCAECGKPISKQYSLCYEHHLKEMRQ